MAQPTKKPLFSEICNLNNGPATPAWYIRRYFTLTVQLLEVDEALRGPRPRVQVGKAQRFFVNQFISFFKKMGQPRPLFLFISSFYHFTI